MSDYLTIDNYDKLVLLQKKLFEESLWAFDIEGTSIDFQQNKIIGIGFSWNKYQGWYVPLKKYLPIIGLVDFWKDRDVNQEDVISVLKDVLGNSSLKIAHNSKYDIKCIKKEWDIWVNNAVDSMLLMSIVKANQKGYSLEAFSELYEDLRGYKLQTKLMGNYMWKGSIIDISFRNNRDTDLAYRLYVDNIRVIEKNKEFINLWKEFIIPLNNLIIDMEYVGVKVDIEYSTLLHKELYNELKQIKKEVELEIGHSINLISTDQVREVLYEDLSLPILKRSKTTDLPSTRKEVLEELSKKTNNPILKKIIDYRSKNANKTAFVDSFVLSCNRIDNKEKDFVLDLNNYYHGNYKLISNTGRLRSGKDINSDEGDSDIKSLSMQNIPRDKRFKKQFIPDEDCYWVSADHSQLELRVLASVARDNTLLRAFEEDYDPHSYVGGVMMGLSYEEVLEGYEKKDNYFVDMRVRAKRIGFGWVYLAEDGTFAYLFPGKTEMERKKAEKEAKERYFSTFNRIVPWRNSVIQEAQINGYITTISGRKLYCPEINSNVSYIRAHAEKQMVNAHIQGPASDLTNMGAIKLSQEIIKKGIRGRVVNLIHDAIYTVAEKERIKEVVELKKKIMETLYFGIKTKLKAEIEVFDRWEGNKIKI